MEFSCSLCNYKTGKKDHIKRHINNKTKCGEGIPEILEILVEIICEYCNNTFASKPNLKRHLKTCKVKKKNLEEVVENLEDKVNKLEQQLSKQSTSTTINNNTTNNTINNNIIIQITPYNDPNLEGVERYYKEAIKKIFMSVPTIIERIHFNKLMPENHNICIKNYRTKLAKVFTGTEWKTMDEDHLIDELVNTYENLLEDWADGDPNKMKYIEKYKEIKERDGADKVDRDLREEVKKLIYDKRAMIKVKN